jgi:phage gp36-like protein
MIWLERLPFLERCPEARGVALQRIDKTGLAPAEIDAAVESAIDRALEDAESRIRSKLLKRFSSDQLPVQPSQASATLQRLVADYAWFELHKKFEIVSDSVEKIAQAVLAELNDIVACGQLELIRNVPPVRPGPRVRITARKRGRGAIPPLTLESLRDWGP